MRASKRGSARKFCSAAHRAQFHKAAKRWAMAALEAGIITVETLQRVPQSVHALGGPVGEGSEAA